jgi:STE24 endopeptidase
LRSHVRPCTLMPQAPLWPIGSPHTLSFLAAVLLLAWAGLRLWLAARHIRHVQAHRHRVPEHFSAVITPDAHQRAADYTLSKTRLSQTEALADTALIALLTLAGGLHILDIFWAQLLGNRGTAHGMALFASVGLISLIAGLPFDLYRTFVLEEKFHFNRSTPAQFVRDLFKQILLSLLIGAPLLWLALLWIDALGDAWWLGIWLFWLAVNLLMALLYPAFIAPLFNRFVPLNDPLLRTRIESLLARCQFSAAGLLVMDGSRRSSHANAYFTGFGRFRRIVFFDTLLDKLDPDEIEAVLAHELGHYKRHHLWKTLGLLCVLSLVFCLALGTLLNSPLFYHALGVSTPSKAMGLILFALWLPVVLLPLRPVFSALSRRHEYEADAYACANAPHRALERALLKLYRDNAATLTPDPLYSLFYDAHPPAALRLARLP